MSPNTHWKDVDLDLYSLPVSVSFSIYDEVLSAETELFSLSVSGILNSNSKNYRLIVSSCYHVFVIPLSSLIYKRLQICIFQESVTKLCTYFILYLRICYITLILSYLLQFPFTISPNTMFPGLHMAMTCNTNFVLHLQTHRKVAQFNSHETLWMLKLGPYPHLFEFLYILHGIKFLPLIKWFFNLHSSFFIFFIAVSSH